MLYWILSNVWLKISLFHHCIKTQPLLPVKIQLLSLLFRHWTTLQPQLKLLIQLLNSLFHLWTTLQPQLKVAVINYLDSNLLKKWPKVAKIEWKVAKKVLELVKKENFIESKLCPCGLWKLPKLQIQLRILLGQHWILPQLKILIQLLILRGLHFIQLNLH